MFLFNKWIFFYFVIISLNACDKHKMHFSGYTDTLYVYLSSPSMGFLDQKLVKRGDEVHQNQILCPLSISPDLEISTAAQFNYKQAKYTKKDLQLPRRLPEIMAIENQILQTKAQIRRVELHLNRLLKLKEKQFIDPDTLDNQTQTLKELNFQQKQYEENLRLAKMGSRYQQIRAQRFAMKAMRAKWKESLWYLTHKTIRAPKDGYVFEVFYTEGELIPAQKPVLVMVVPEYNYVEFFVSAAEVSKIQKGQKILYQFYGDKLKYTAAINYISNKAEYMPPILYTSDHQEELVFRVRAKPESKKTFPLGQPIEVWL